MTTTTAEALQERAVSACRPRYTSPLTRPDQAAALAADRRTAGTVLDAGVLESRRVLTRRMTAVRLYARGYGRAYIAASLQPGVTPLRLLAMTGVLEAAGARGPLVDGWVDGLAAGWADRCRRSTAKCATEEQQ